MIDVDQLRTLGWDEALIAEVTRQAQDLQRNAVVEALPTVRSSVEITGSAVYLQTDFAPHAASNYLVLR